MNKLIWKVRPKLVQYRAEMDEYGAPFISKKWSDEKVPYCSNCGKLQEGRFLKFCDNCGVEFEGEEDE